MPQRRHTPTRQPAAGNPDLLDLAWRVFMILLIGALAYLFVRGIHFVLLAFAGILFAVFLSAIAGWLQQHTGLGYKWSLAAVVLGLTCLIGLGVWRLANRLALQAAELSKQLPESLDQGRQYLEGFTWGKILLDESMPAVQSYAKNTDFARLTGVLTGMTDFVMAIVVIVFVGIFAAAEPGIYRRGAVHLIPFSRRERVGQALDAVGVNLRHWLVGQVVLMVLMAVTTTIGLSIIGLPMALLLGVVTGVFEIVPYLGAWVSAILACLTALLLGPTQLAMTAGLYVGLHVLEGYVLVPLVQRRSVHLPPALTLVTQLLLGHVLGLMGILVAAPLTVAAIVFIKMFYIQDALGDHTVKAAPGMPARSTAAPPEKTAV